MKITDEMVEAACFQRYGPQWGIEVPGASDKARASMRRCLVAALAAQPDRYKAGFERAREMALDVANHTGAHGSKFPTDITSWAQGVKDALDACSAAIRNMEMPDDK